MTANIDANWWQQYLANLNGSTPTSTVNRSAPTTPPAIPQPANLQGLLATGPYNQQAINLSQGVQGSNPYQGITDLFQYRQNPTPIQPYQMPTQAPTNPNPDPVDPYQQARQAWLGSLTEQQRAMLGDGNKANNRDLMAQLTPQQRALRDQYRALRNLGMGG